MKIDIGIEPGAREKVAHSLSEMLADTYTLYLKTHNYHWNVTGPMFDTLHKMFEAQYNEMWVAVDELAERIRALGHPAPGSYAAFGKLARVSDAGDGVPEAKQMIRQLVEDHETVVRTARGVLKVASDAGDDVTEDLVTGRMQVHEKTAWMLRSLLE
jgi:starvation-inducible DNA-binding protein